MAVCYRLIIKRISRQVELNDSLDQPRTNNQENVENGDRETRISSRQNITNDNKNAISRTEKNNISALAKHKRRVKIVKNRKLAHRLFILIAVFCICMLPTFLGGIAGVGLQLYQNGYLPSGYDILKRDSLFMNHLRMWTAIGGALNSVINPFIYIFTYSKFKAELRKMFPWFARMNNKIGVK